VFVDDFFDVLWLNVRIPDGVRVYDDQRTVSTLIETTSFVNSNILFQTELIDLFAKFSAHGFRAFGRTRFAADTNEYMLLEDCHQLIPFIAL
jgi:hypothetical protein